MTNRLREDVVRNMAIRYGAAANVVTFAEDGEAAGAIAADIGRPVAIKLVADDVVHKSKAGGVLLGVEPNQVAEQTNAMLSRHREQGAHVRGVTIEEMVDPGLETVVGGLREPGFGPVVMFGQGGVDIEVLDDVAFALAPLSHDEALQLILQTRIGRVISGRLPDRIPELVETVLAVGGQEGMLVSEDITEIDLNPVVVSANKIVAVDARATALDRPAPAIELPDPADSYNALRPAIYPESIAIVGASADIQKMGYRVVRNLVDFGYKGQIYPVSRSSAAICGVATIPSVAALPRNIDRAVLALPAQAVPEALAALAARGTKSAHVYTSDTPPVNPSLKESGLRVIGPNCIGHYSPGQRVTMIGHKASSSDTGSIAVVSQSGTYAGDIVRRGKELGLKFSFVTSVGNCDDVSPAEFLAFCEADPRTTAVAFYLEDDRGADAFFRLAKGMTKPVVLLKGGRTLAGGAAAASHTGALASDPQLLEDVAQQAGVLLVENLDELLDVLEILQATPDIQGDRLGLIGSGGGVAVVGADTADAWNLSLPRLSDDVLTSLERFAAPGTSLTNPIDVPIWSLFKGTESYTGAIIEAAAADEQIDVLCAFLDLGTVFDMHEGQAGDEIVELLTHDLLSAARKDKLLALVLRSGLDQHQEDLIRRLRLTAGKAGVPMFDSVDRAIAAIGGVRTLTRWGKSRLDCVQL